MKFWIFFGIGFIVLSIAFIFDELHNRKLDEKFEKDKEDEDDRN